MTLESLWKTLNIVKY